jgi:hypothetical protein
MFGKKKVEGTSKLANLTPPGSEPEPPAEEEQAQAPVEETTPETPAPAVESKPKPKPKQSTGIIRKAKKAAHPTSFRLTDDDKAALQRIVDKVNGEANSKISRDKVIQALIHAGDKMPPARILKALRDIL